MKNPFIWITGILLISIGWVNFGMENKSGTSSLPMDYILSGKISPELEKENISDSIQQKYRKRNKFRDIVLKDKFNTKAHYQYINAHFEIPKTWNDSIGSLNYRSDSDIIYEYNGYLTSFDSATLQMGRFGRGLISCFKNSPHEAKIYFNFLEEIREPYVQYALGINYILLEDTSKAIRFLNNEVKIKDGGCEESYIILAQVYKDRNDQEALYQLALNSEARKYIETSAARKVLFLHQDWINYIKVIVQQGLKHLNPVGFFAAFLITMIWGFYIIKLNIFKENNYYISLLMLLLGASWCLFVFILSDYNKIILGNTLNGEFWNDLAYSILGIGLIEEFVKILPLLLIVILFPDLIKEPYEYILYACLSALGFAFTENLIYFDESAGHGIIHARSLTSVVGHAIDSSIVAYGFVLSKFRYKKFPIYISFPLFLLLASIVHGLYDFSLMQEWKWFFIFIFLFSIMILTVIQNNSMNNSPAFDYNVKFNSEDLRFFLVVSLTLILAFEYVTAAYKFNTTYANVSLFYNGVRGSIFIGFFLSRFSRIELVKNSWQSINSKYSEFWNMFQRK
jgi:RsiW-degrading membrane proteinase PrsW (M82 family)